MSTTLYSTVLYVQNLEATKTFYQTIGCTVEEHGQVLKVIGESYRIAFIADEKEGSPTIEGARGAGVELYFSVEDIHHCARKVQEAGLVAEATPIEQPWGKTELHLKDPDEYAVVLFQ